jgi:tRNA A-37 threonylcarbamoyl transferase component Bud32
MSPPVEMTVGGVRWWVAPECRDHLFGPAGLRLEEWLRAGQACVVKHGPHRVVYRIELPGLRCHLKHNRIADTRSWLRQLVRASKARSEYGRALAVARRGVPTIVPLALGEACQGLGPRESFLLTRTLEGALMLHKFVETKLAALPPEGRARLRRDLAARLGEFIAQVHDAGIRHDDLHCGNILVHLDGAGRPSFYLVDLQSVRLGRPLGWHASRKNLVVLNRWPSLFASRTDRLRFWQAYCRARRALEVPHRAVTAEWARRLERQTQRSNQQLWRHRDRRCRGDNRSYRRVSQGPVEGHAVTDLDPQALAGLLADPDGPFRAPGVRLLKDSRSATVAELELAVGGKPRAVIYKRFRLTDPTDPWVSRLRWAPAMRSWVYGHGLRERGLPTARPLAVLHRKRCGLYHEGYLLMEKVPDALDLRQLAATLARAGAQGRRRALRPLVEKLARVIHDLHRRRLSHRDLKAANILVQMPGGDPSAASFWLIDLVGVARHRRLPVTTRVKNLARLHASFHQNPLLTRTDKLRFLRAYLQWGLYGKQGWKEWWQAVEAATLAKAARNARGGRPLA